MIYIEIIENKPIRSTSSLELAQNYKNRIVTNFEDYTCINNKYKYDEKLILLF